MCATYDGCKRSREERNRQSALQVLDSHSSHPEGSSLTERKGCLDTQSLFLHSFPFFLFSLDSINLYTYRDSNWLKDNIREWTGSLFALWTRPESKCSHAVRRIEGLKSFARESLFGATTNLVERIFFLLPIFVYEAWPLKARCKFFLLIAILDKCLNIL